MRTKRVELAASEARARVAIMVAEQSEGTFARHVILVCDARAR